LTRRHPPFTFFGIAQVDTIDDIDSDSEDDVGDNSEFDKNLEISELEKRDSDDEDGLE
jgi:hypothetical protein